MCEDKNGKEKKKKMWSTEVLKAQKNPNDKRLRTGGGFSWDGEESRGEVWARAWAWAWAWG